ncbi:5-hydroxytryptamine receptor 3B [Phyllopteryx taeniolatus]|uniref:5-hydroxytryptamine receptor 3B n=1 Tax=Phyllopteryx taeniolatus TaxID=161469 RepID=UPI002AD4F135|nr:5-hydroxytryptamine receptor 3B [Phyllopteryx taeniolatus]
MAKSVPEKPKRSAPNQLTRTLLRKYDCGVRPVHNWTSATTVYVDFILQSVLDVDSKTQSITTSIWYRQIWTDEFLVWDPDEFDGINEISLSSDAIWIPDIIVNEVVDEGRSAAIPYVYVNSSGCVKNYRPMQVVLACSLEMYAFPFDKQNCSLTFRSWLHSVKEIDLALWRSAEAIANDQMEFMNDGEWELLSVPSRYWRLQQGDADYAHVCFHVLIRRRPLLYVVGLLIPSIFLMIVDVMSFYLPVSSSTRIGFKISTLLGYTLFRVNLTDELPATAVTTPLIGKNTMTVFHTSNRRHRPRIKNCSFVLKGVFFAVCMALLMLSLIKSILVVKLLHHSEKEVREMSVSACLLDKYGLAESTLTSTRTLDQLNQSGDFEFEASPEEDVESLTDIQQNPSSLEWLLRELVSLRLAFSQEDTEASAQAEWLALCSKLDRFLFRLYLIVLAVYAGTLLLFWASWSFA